MASYKLWYIMGFYKCPDGAKCSTISIHAILKSWVEYQLLLHFVLLSFVGLWAFGFFIFVLHDGKFGADEWWLWIVKLSAEDIVGWKETVETCKVLFVQECNVSTLSWLWIGMSSADILRIFNVNKRSTRMQWIPIKHSPTVNPVKVG